MLDFGTLPPEINSARMYSGPGPASMLAAAAAWQELAGELNSAAASGGSVVSNLAGGSWLGPSSASMAAAATPYLTWLSATAAQAEQAAGQATAAVTAFETAFAATVPPPLIAANRSLLATLVATNILGQNTPAIAATEAHYAEMWAQDAAAMYGYAAASSAAAQVTPFEPAPPTTDPAGLADQAAAVAQAAGTAAGTPAQEILSSGPQLISATPSALQALASPQGLESLVSSGASGGTSGSSLSSLSGLSSLMMPLRMATMPMSMLMRMLMMGGANGAAKGATAGLASTASTVGTASSAIGARALGAVTLTGLTSAAPAPTAALGQAVSFGALSVPPGWTAVGTTINPAAAALSGTGAAPLTGMGHVAVPPMMPIANMAGRTAAGGGAATQYDFRANVVPRSPIGG